MLIIFVSAATGEQIRAFLEWGERKIAEPCRIEANENWNEWSIIELTFFQLKHFWKSCKTK